VDRPRRLRPDTVRELVTQGLSDVQIGRRLGVTATTVRRYRLRLDLPANSGPTTLADKLSKFSDPNPDPVTGCVLWTGRVNAGGTPTIRHNGREYMAARVAFTLATGREPVGHVMAECGNSGCVAEAHVLDQPSRLGWRLALRAAAGMPEPWDECRWGHRWDGHGRITRDLEIYCRTCQAAREHRPRED